ncbi:MAG: ATP-binding protein [Planctomycetes bacterium]|nr:ATP-binding protein [Planctomycetota bacterium]
MAFVTGPRQVGKTTACRTLANVYLNWDDEDDRRDFLKGSAVLASRLGLDRLRAAPPVAVFDELHKFRRWKTLLKGFFDAHGDAARILVTGSSRLDVYRRGGDSLMGRYFPYRMHPFTVAETLAPELPDPQRIHRPPARVEEADFKALWEHGGYPEPFVRRDARFTRRWAGLRRQQLVREDLRDLTRIQELGQIDVLTALLSERSGEQLVHSNLAQEIRVSVDTLRRWIDTLCGFHLGFLVRPWFRNVERSLRKEPKWFLSDWSGVAEPGKRAETFLACHLLKAAQGWTDLGLGAFELRYLRDKEKRAVDFVLVRDRKPWALVEVKLAEDRIGPALAHFQGQTGAPYAFQAVMEADYVAADCFALPRGPMRVPARTLLSQLL